MATAIRLTGKAKSNSLSDWQSITVHFDDGTKRDIPDVTATLRQIMELAREPQHYERILGLPNG